MEATMQTNANTPLITDQLLTELASPDCQASMGEWDDETRAMMAVAVPEMAAELLQRRAALCIAIHPEAAQQSVERARAIIRAPDPIAPRALMAACQTLLMHSRNAAERSAARDIIKEMEAAA
jgi:hypothetical protein